MSGTGPKATRSDKTARPRLAVAAVTSATSRELLAAAEKRPEGRKTAGRTSDEKKTELVLQHPMVADPWFPTPQLSKALGIKERLRALPWLIRIMIDRQLAEGWLPEAVRRYTVALGGE